MKNITQSIKQVFDRVRKGVIAFLTGNGTLEDQKSINQINAVISLLAKETLDLLPDGFVSYFSERADKAPKDSLDMSKPFKDQDFTDEALLLVYFINMTVQESIASGASTAKERYDAFCRAKDKFVEIVMNRRIE